MMGNRINQINNWVMKILRKGEKNKDPKINPHHFIRVCSKFHSVLCVYYQQTDFGWQLKNLQTIFF